VAGLDWSEFKVQSILFHIEPYFGLYFHAVVVLAKKKSPTHIHSTNCSHEDDISHHASVCPPQSTPSPPVAMASDNRASLLPFAAAVLVVLLAGGAAADDASSDDDAGTSRTPGCSNKFQLVMDLPCPLLTRFAVLLH
jgi:hypothetical protein